MSWYRSDQDEAAKQHCCSEYGGKKQEIREDEKYVSDIPVVEVKKVLLSKVAKREVGLRPKW